MSGGGGGLPAFARSGTNKLKFGEGSMARILIAEDEESIRNLVARALRQDGHEVTTASDGAEALDVLVRHKGAFELLLTDIRMPVMDGIALALAAARDHPELVILLMTGYADQRERAHGLDALIHDVITKPFSLGVMRTAVNGALSTSPRRMN
jgi:two-component system, cell cycle response regulator CpdR